MNAAGIVMISHWCQGHGSISNRLPDLFQGAHLAQ
jgi:hypothetical protein